MEADGSAMVTRMFSARTPALTVNPMCGSLWRKLWP
jgi:hypothetical protein